MFTVSQYDSFGYLFYQPTFISLDPTVTAGSIPSIPVQGIRIGLNGAVPQVGQAYIPLSTAVSASNYTPRARCCRISAPSSACRAAPLTDQFFLTFDVLGGHKNVVVEPAPTTPPFAPGPVVADIGVRTFAKVIPPCRRSRAYRRPTPRSTRPIWRCKQQLPSDPTLEGFSSSNQIGIAQLANSILQRGGEYAEPADHGVRVGSQPDAVQDYGGSQFRDQRPGSPRARRRPEESAGSIDADRPL